MEVYQRLVLHDYMELSRTNHTGRFYASEGVDCDLFNVLYAYVCGVMSESVRESITHVGNFV